MQICGEEQTCGEKHWSDMSGVMLQVALLPAEDTGCMLH